MLKFFEQDGQSIRFIGDILNIYLPKNYFEANISEFNGNEVNTIAFFYFEVKSFQMEEKKQDGSFYIMKLPARIDFEFDDRSSTTKNIRNSGEIQYEVLTMNKGSLFVKNINVVQSAANAKDFLYMLHKGRFPSLIPYSEIIDIYMKNLEINKLDLGCVALMYELMVGELMRDRKNPKEPFRKTINKSGVDEMAYKNISMKDIAFYNSTYTAIGFENFDKAVNTGIAKDIRQDKEVISPVEKVLKY